MKHYIKTELGIQALQQRLFGLSPKLRRLLLLIGTPDFQKLTIQLQQNIATPEMLQHLEQLGLIQNIQTQNQTHIQESRKIKEIVRPQEKHEDAATKDIPVRSQAPLASAAQVNLAFENEIILPKLNFYETKKLMIQLLHQNCGLMAKILIQKIENAEHSQALKLCQMQWLTALQETRISPLELNKNLQTINYSMRHF
ncbi:MULTISPECIES: hypothetical protein [Acinetobacter]|uniref:Uncharacterized protein n=1 Tax=Acinetobacter piscicola TaxID=2006115 RepID=A0A7S6VXH5_9GAMM|nr:MULTISPECIES: hypothetical protein [Acinetobacter]QOW46709.1 hypothetical protein G0028_12825 [Acinetobacter piscicola]